MSLTATVSNSSATGLSPRLSALPIDASYSSEAAIAFGDEAAGQKIQPDRLAVARECFDRVHDADCCISPMVSFRTFPAKRPRKVCLWLGHLKYPNSITPFAR